MPYPLYTTFQSHIATSEDESCIPSSLELPHLPDMLFNDNTVEIKHEKGFGIEFNAINALENVNAHEDLVHVSLSKEWLEARYCTWLRIL